MISTSSPGLTRRSIIPAKKMDHRITVLRTGPVMTKGPRYGAIVLRIPACSTEGSGAEVTGWVGAATGLVSLGL